MAQPLRLGLIGAGRWGRNYIRTIAGLDGVALVRVGSRNPETPLHVPPSCTVTPEWRQVIDQRFVDAVIIATPPALHAEMTRAAVEAGLPVLVEKPLTLDRAEAESLKDFVASRGGLVMVEHTQLFHPAYRKLKEVAPVYGSIHVIHSEAGNFGPFRADTSVLWDWGSHDVAMCLDLLGNFPSSVEAIVREQQSTPAGMGQIIDLSMEFPAGISARVCIGNIMPRRRMFSVQLDRGMLVYDDLAESRLRHIETGDGLDMTAPGEGIPIPFDYEPPLTCAVREFAAAARAHVVNADNLALAVDVVRVLSSCITAS